MSARFVPAFLATALLAPAALADCVVAGKVLYKDRPFAPVEPCWTGEDLELPVRHAKVEIIDNATGGVLAIGATDEAGEYGITVPGSGNVDLLVRCFSRVGDASLGTHVFRVRSGIAPNAEYSVSSAVFSGWDLDVPLDAGAIVALPIVVNPNDLPSVHRIGNPFGMYDNLVWSVQYVMSMGAGAPSKDIVVIWPSLQATGGWCDSTSTGYVNLFDSNMSSVGDNDVVLLHELGHVMQCLYSNTFAPTTPHLLLDSDQDPRQSVTEGWATYFAVSVRQYLGAFDPSWYIACMTQLSPPGAMITAKLRLESMTPNLIGPPAGEASEAAIAGAFWDLNDTPSTDDGDAIDDDQVDGSPLFLGGLTGEQVVWNVFDTGAFANTPSNATIETFWNGFYLPVNQGNYRATRDVFDIQGMRFYKNFDEEENNSVATASPLALNTWSETRTLYFTDNIPGVPGNGDSDVYSFAATTGHSYEIRTRYPGGSNKVKTYVDPYLILRAPDGTTTLATDDNGAGGVDRNAVITFTAAETGTFFAEVTTIHAYRRLGSYEVRVLELP